MFTLLTKVRVNNFYVYIRVFVPCQRIKCKTLEFLTLLMQQTSNHHFNQATNIGNVAVVLHGIQVSELFRFSGADFRYEKLDFCFSHLWYLSASALCLLLVKAQPVVYGDAVCCIWGGGLCPCWLGQWMSPQGSVSNNAGSPFHHQVSFSFLHVKGCRVHQLQCSNFQVQQ